MKFFYFIPFALFFFTPYILTAQIDDGLSETHLIFSIEGESNLDDLIRSDFPVSPSTTFIQKNCLQSKNNNEHCRYQMNYQGIPIKAGQVTSHFYQRSNLTKFFVPKTLPFANNNLVVNPTLTLEEAEEIVKKKFPLNESTHLHPSSESEAKGLIFVPADYNFKKPIWILAYEIDLHAEAPMLSKRITINAQNGEIIFIENRLCSFVPGTAETMFHGTRPVETTAQGGGFVLNDQTRGDGIRTYNLNNGGQLFFDDDNYWDNNNAAMDHTAGDVHWGSAATFDFYGQLGLDGLDSNGKGVESNVHLDDANAYWNGTRTAYGDGLPGKYDLPFTHISIVGHEMTHAVTDYHSDLIYSGEPGGLNESISDIIGVSMQHQYDSDTNIWLIGDDASSTGEYFRNMANPKDVEMADTYLGEYWFDSTNPHRTSSIGNYWFYLLVTGGTGTNDNGYEYDVPSIGWEATWELANTTWVYYLSGSSDYMDCATFSIEVARQQFGACAAEVDAVFEAWTAVGVIASGTVNLGFTPSSTLICELPATVSFSPVGEISNFEWDFGDGNFSNEMNPIHEYTENGLYSVSLTGLDCDAEPVTILREDLILVDTAASFCDSIYMTDNLNQVTNSCSGVLVDNGDVDGNYSNSVEAELTIEAANALGYLVTFESFQSESCCDDMILYVDSGNGFEIYDSYAGYLSYMQMEIFGQRLKFVWDTDGSVTADGFVITWECLLPSQPIANFSVSNTTTCDGFSFLFDESTGFPDSWTWLVNQTEVSNEQNPLLEFPTAGTYDIGLIACNDVGCDTLTIPDYITYDPTQSFCDTLVLIDEFETTSFSCSGVLVDDGGVDGDYSNSIDAEVILAAPNTPGYLISFEYFESESCCDDLFIFADYGNGFELYDSYAGVLAPFEVEIVAQQVQIIWDTDGSVTRDGFVISWECLTPMQPVANFSSANTLTCDGFSFLEDETTGFPTSWVWLIDNVEASTDQNPILEFLAPGTYDIGLIACNDIGCDTLTIPDYITYDPTQVFCDTIVMIDDLISTSASCTGVMIDDGGVDGDYSNSVEAELILAAPNVLGYFISFEYFESESCCDDLSIYADYGNGFEFYDSYAGVLAPFEIEVIAQQVQIIWDTDGSVTRDGFVISWQCLTPTQPVANFSTSNTLTCDGFSFLEDETTGFPTSWVWLIDNVAASTDQNPMLEFSASGTYDIGLIACNDIGCDTLIIPDYITYDPTQVFCDTIVMIDDLISTSASCTGVIIDDGGVDGNYSNSVEAELILAAPNTPGYLISFEYFDSESCCDDLFIYADYGNGFELYDSYAGSLAPFEVEIIAQQVQIIWDTDGSVIRDGFVIKWECLVPVQPVANFSTENTLTCDGFSFLEDETTGFPTSWSWTVDNVEVSTEQNPVLEFLTPGSYDIGLIACNDIGCDSLTIPDFINYDPSQTFCDTIVMVEDLIMTTQSCAGVLVDDGGVDGSYSNSVEAELIIAAPNALGYHIEFESFNTESCCDDIFLYADYGNGFELYDSYAGTIAAFDLEIVAQRLQFIWDADGSVTGDGFVISWECFAADVPPIISPSHLVLDCSQSVSFTANTSNADNIEWMFGDGNTATGNMVDHTYEAIGTYVVTIVASNDFGTTNETFNIEIEYQPVFFEMDDEILVNTNLKVNPTTHQPTAITSIEWFLNGDLIAQEFGLNLNFSELGNYTLICVLVDENGCTSTHAKVFDVVEVLSVYDSNLEDQLLIFPNPTMDELNIQNLSSLSKDVEITLYNNVGLRTLYRTAPIGTDQIKLDLENISPGVYYLKVEVIGKGHFNKKIVIL